MDTHESFGYPREFRCALTVNGPILRLLRVTTLLTFCHYLIYPFVLAGSAVVIWRKGWLPRNWLLLGIGGYVAQLLCYKPHMRGGWRNEWFRALPIWDLCQTWLDPTWIVESELDPNKTYIFAIAPHGIIGACRLFFEGRMWRRLFPHLKERPRWVGATPQFLVPGCRELMLAFAFDASKVSFQREVRAGGSVFLLPGGTQELMLTDTSQDTKQVIMDRKGFVKMGFQEGCEIVPVMVFGEKWCYTQVLLPSWLRKFLYRFKIPGTFFIGWKYTLVPGYQRHDEHGRGKPIKAGIVFGRPVERPQNATCDDEALDLMHKIYMDRMRDIFAMYKGRFGYEEAQTSTFVPANSKTK